MSEDEMKPNEVTEEAKAEEPEDPKGPEWQYRTEFGAVKQMREVVKLTISATEAEVQALHRKLERLQYGS